MGAANLGIGGALSLEETVPSSMCSGIFLHLLAMPVG